MLLSIKRDSKTKKNNKAQLDIASKVCADYLRLLPTSVSFCLVYFVQRFFFTGFTYSSRNPLFPNIMFKYDW